MTSSEGWRGEPQSGHTGPETGCVEGLVFILTALGEGLQMLAFWGGAGCYIHVWCQKTGGWGDEVGS